MKVNLKNMTTRGLHRDLGYLFLGLIVSFAISGIAFNHRKSWDPEKYVYSSKTFTAEMQKNEKFDEEFGKKIAGQLGLSDEFRGIRERGGEFAIFIDGGTITLDAKTGQGKLEMMSTRPVLGQMTKLHKSTNSFWIWYSDVFAIALATIAITGLFLIKNGKKTFKKRGWKLALFGLIAPIVMLFL